ncbi:MAG: ribose 5-phosphate isomerase A [Candidatus Hodarchaeales archaeon]|jgi:ribose 5-phosphate isomerase A
MIENSKKIAAERAVEENITKKDMVVGIGSGSTIVYAIKKLAEMDRTKNLNFKCIPSSFQSQQLILENGLQMASLDQYPIIDIDIDGADEIDRELNAIKGGGGCLVQEKIIAANSSEVIIIADYRKNSKFLGENWKKGLPIEIIPMAHVPLLEKMKKLGGNPTLRIAKAKTGPLITDNGNFIIDVDFGIIENPSVLDEKISSIPGVVDTGLFIGIVTKAYLGQKDGSVLVLNR